MSIELSIEEAREVARIAVETAPGGASFEAFPEALKLQAIGGAMQIVSALQILGYRIVKPLAAVPDGR